MMWSWKCGTIGPSYPLSLPQLKTRSQVLLKNGKMRGRLPTHMSLPRMPRLW